MSPRAGGAPASAARIEPETEDFDVPTTLSEAEARVQRIFRERMALDVPSADADLFESGLVDSLTFVELLVHLEEEFGRRISLDELELEDLRSVGRIAHLMSRNGSGPP